jgi:Raf kinase inhibitor-like YbhB/YbcL family protein
VINRIFFCSAIVLLLMLADNSFAAKMKLKSGDFKNGKRIGQTHIFNDFGCKGDNSSPELVFIDVPKEAKSLAVTMFDPDAPTGSGWWHWVVYNIEPTITKISTGDKRISDNATFGRNDYGTYNYGGPCPPLGTRHRYVFNLYALDVEELDLPSDASAAMIGYYINSHKIKQADLNAFYYRKK